MKKRKIVGTNKFIIYLYNGGNVKGRKINAKRFIGKQWGRVWEVNEDGKMIGNGYPFVDYGQLIHFINVILAKTLRKNLKKIKCY